MRIVGLTGGIGSGKSSVSKILREFGAYVIDADDITHELEERGAPVWLGIRQAFGWPVLLCDGELDRKRLGHRVFGDAQERRRLNAIVHPAVQEEIRHRLAQAREAGTAVAVLDVPLLIEGGLHRLADAVWVVYADPEDQARRIQERDGMSAEAAWKRIRAQMPLVEKCSYADVVIDNRGQWNEVEEVVQRLWQSVVFGG